MSERKNKNVPVAHLKHSRAATKIAEIITGGQYGSHKRYHTTYGGKTVMGIADLIDNETALPQLLADCQELLDKIEEEHGQDHADGFTDHGNEPDDKDCPVCQRIAETQKLLDRAREGE